MFSSAGAAVGDEQRQQRGDGEGERASGRGADARKPRGLRLRGGAHAVRRRR